MTECEDCIVIRYVWDYQEMDLKKWGEDVKSEGKILREEEKKKKRNKDEQTIKTQI